MNGFERLNRRQLLRAGAAFGSGLVALRAGSHEVITSTLRVVHPWSRATTADATSAVLCMVFDDVSQDDRLISVESPVAAGAEMGGRAARTGVDFFIPQGRVSQLAEHEAHVRLTGLKFPLAVGTSHPVTLGFEKGGVYITTFTVDFTHFD